jgi:hypothetical protein
MKWFLQGTSLDETIKLSATYFDDKSKTSVVDFDFRW